MRKNIILRATNFDTKLGEPYKNLKSIKEEIKKADEEGVKILLFPELSLTGSSLYDGFLQEDLQEAALFCLMDLIEFSKDYDLAFTVGLPLKIHGRLHNACLILRRGEAKGFYIKSNLKTLEKGVFAPFQYFYDLEFMGLFANEVCEISGLRIGLTLGEDDLFLNENEGSFLYEKYLTSRADLILNAAAYPRTVLSGKRLKERASFISQEVTYLSASQGRGESSTDFVFEGSNLLAKDGRLLDFKRNEAVTLSVSFDFKAGAFDFEEGGRLEEKVSKFPYLPTPQDRDEFCRDILEIQGEGLLSRMRAIGCRKIVLGISGGLDSTMALLAAYFAFKKEGLPLENILAYSMPAFGTSRRTRSNARALCKRLGVSFQEIDITETVKSHFVDIGHDLETMDVTYENAQARERTQVLFDLANAKSALVLGTGDLSELAQGFATYNGDHMSSYSINASLSKTELRYLLDRLCEKLEDEDLVKILRDILKTPISPELKKEGEGEISQKTEDILGPYELIDFFTYEVISCHYGPEKIYRDACLAFKGDYDRETVKKRLTSFYRRFATSQFKRSVAVDGPNVTGRSFSPRAGFRLPSDLSPGAFLADEDEK